MKTNLLFAVILFAGLISLNSCKKETLSNVVDFVTTTEDIGTQNDFILATEEEADVISFGLLDNGAAEERGCGTVTYEKPKGTYPNTITIDFGSGCTDANGKVKKGKIIIAVSGDMTQQGSVRTVTHENFYIDGVKVEGTKKLENKGLSTTGTMCFTRTVTDHKLTFPDGSTATWNGSQTLCQTEGISTKARVDDVFSITGTTTGINRKGKSFESTVVTPLVKKFVCPWFTSGTSKVTIDGNVASIEFGDGNCDRIAVVTLPDGTTKTIQIRKWW